MKRVSQSYKHKKLNFASSLNGFGRGFQALDESANLRNSLISALVNLYLKTKLSVLGPLTYRNTEIKNNTSDFVHILSHFTYYLESSQ